MVNTLNGWLRKIPAWLIYIVGAAYAVWLFYLGVTGGLGVEPINALEREYGEIALKLLIAGLVITPLRNWTGINLIKFRRTIGVTTFFFVLAHLTVWAVLDVQSLSRVWADIVKRPYITVGTAAFLMLLPLAITSNNRMVRKLGPVKWRKLHMLTYPAALLGAIHFVWLVRGWPLEPFVYLGIIIALLLMRIKIRSRRVAAKA